MIRVLLADDQLLVRSGTSMLIDRTADMTVVGEAATGREAVAEVRRLRPDIALMDVQMSDGDGIEAVRQIAGEPKNRTRVIIVTTSDLDECVFESLRAGASGYLLKRTSTADLLEGIRLVALGHAMLSPQIARRVIEEIADHPFVSAAGHERAEMLTNRERQVLACAARGHTNAEIAEELHISESTAKTHLKRVLMKLDLRDRVGAVVFAYEAGVVRPGSNGSTVTEEQRQCSPPENAHARTPIRGRQWLLPQGREIFDLAMPANTTRHLVHPGRPAEGSSRAVKQSTPIAEPPRTRSVGSIQRSLS